jgi:hypothetical protein
MIEDIEMTPQPHGVGEILRHMLLPAVALLFGATLLLGFLSYSVSGQAYPWNLGAGGAFTALGSWELRFWWRRLRRLA